ncbi:MAG: hypothetical protein PHH30_06300 [Bacteroidales bacterium]|nr:hypothetical protein [Bacteroidales bacterium]
MIEAYSFVADVDTVEIFTERVKAFYIGDYYTKEESLNYVQNLIISNAEFKKYIEEKAETNDVSFERQLSDDANYLIENAKIKLGIPL